MGTGKVAPAGGGAPVGAPFIDERSATERTARKTTPKEPGTLRSWHEDSKGRLPDNNVSTLAAGASQTDPGTPASTARVADSLRASCSTYASPIQVHDRHVPASK